MHAEYILTQWIMTSDTVLRKICTSHFIERVRKGYSRFYYGVGNWTKTATYWPPQPLRASPCVVLVLRGPNSLLDDGFLYHILSLTHLISNSIGSRKGLFCRVVAFPTTSCLLLLWSPTNWLPVFTELHNCSITYLIFGMACLIVIKRK